MLLFLCIAVSIDAAEWYSICLCYWPCCTCLSPWIPQAWQMAHWQNSRAWGKRAFSLTLLVKCLGSFFFLKLLKNLFICKAEFSAAITPVFSVTWSFRNHSSILICCSNRSMLKTVVLLNIFMKNHDTLVSRILHWTKFKRTASFDIEMLYNIASVCYF